MYAPDAEITSEAQARAYGGDNVIAVAGGHMLMWSAFDETADAVLRFLSA
jgi:hypothetical protein